jgi:hypothetical protein
VKTKFLFLILIAATALLPVHAEQPKTAAATERTVLLQLDRNWQQAVVDGNAKFLRQWTAEDFSFTHWGKSTSDTKADWIEWATQKPRHFLSRKVSDQSVEIHGDAALVFGRVDVRTLGATPEAPQRCYAIAYVHLYGLRDGQWKFLSHRTTQSLEPVHPCARDEDR